jgi:hypothetical protein
VKLICSSDELVKRITNDSRSRFGKLTSLELFNELNDAGAFIDPQVTADRLVLDTTNLSPDEAASQIASELQLIQ